MIDLGRVLHNRLQGKRLTVEATPELRALREQLLARLRQALVVVAWTVEGFKATPFGTAAVCQGLGDLLLELGQAQDAKKLYLQGYEAVKPLAEAEPDNDQAQANLAVMILRLGDAALNADGDPGTALDRYREARTVAEGVLKRPGRKRPELSCKIDVSHDDMHVGWALMALGRPAEANESFEEARKLRREWCNAQPKSWEAKSYLMQTEEWLGIAASHLGREKELRDHFKESLRMGEALLKEYAWRLAFRIDLAEVEGEYGDALMRLGQTEEAAKAYQESLKYLQPVIDANPDDMSNLPLLALVHDRLASVGARRVHREEAEKHVKEALKLRTDLLQLEAENLPRQADLIVAQARAGKYEEATANAVEVQSLADKSPELMLKVARCYALCAAGDAPKKAQHTELALKALGAATGSEFKDPVWLETDPDLEAVRAAPGFKALVTKVKGR
jgi:tetratricopeptide (TPR) repeat protein